MDDNRNNMDIEASERKKEDIKARKITEYYKDKDIAQFFKTLLDNRINRMLEELNHYYDIGDWRNCIRLLKKININRLFPLFKKEYKIQLLDTIMNKLIPNIYFYSMSDINLIIEFLASHTKAIPKDYIFDWKKFYLLFYSINIFENSSDTKNYIAFYTKLHKFIPENAITYEDYQILKRTVLDDLINNLKNLTAIYGFMFFLPKKFLENDDKIQLRLFNMFKNWKSNFIPSCCLFSKILKNHGKLYFSKDPKENEEYIKKFIQFYFTYFNLYIIGDSKVQNKNSI
jgi:hypothetical protein